MPVYPVDRYEWTYTTGRFEHSVSLFRKATVPAPEFQDAFRGFLLNTVGLFHASVIWQSLAVQIAGNTFTNPLPFNPVQGELVAAIPVEREAFFAGLWGRSDGGRRFGTRIFGTGLGTGTNFRFAPGEDTNADLLLSEWTALASNVCDKTGLGGPVYGYVNVAYDAYWQRNLR